MYNNNIGFTKHAQTAVLKTLIDKYCNTKGGRLYTFSIDFRKALCDSVIHTHDTGLEMKLLNIYEYWQLLL